VQLFWLLGIRQSLSTSLLIDPVSFDFFLFPNVKLQPKGRRFDSIKEIQTVSQNAMKTMTRNDFQQCFRSWKYSWDLYINAEGDYIEAGESE
jgi:hypothetical protein